MIIDKSIAFFDVDSLEYSSDRNVLESEIPHLSFRERVIPIASLLNCIYSYASRNNHLFVFSACCSARTPSIEEMPHVLHIPAQINDSSWKNRLDDHSMFFIEKAITDHTQSDFLNKMYDKFKQNKNLTTFIDTLGAYEWVVFGNGAAFCVYPALMSLIDSGQKVTILSDVLIDSAPGHATQTPSELRLKMLDDCASRGASVCTLKIFWKSKDLEFYSKAGSLPILIKEECL